MYVWQTSFSLHNRADEANIKTTEAQSSLQEAKQRNVWLEKQLGKAKVEGGANSGKGANKSTVVGKASNLGSYIADSDLVQGDLPLNQPMLDELQTRYSQGFWKMSRIIQTSFCMKHA